MLLDQCLADRQETIGLTGGAYALLLSTVGVKKRLYSQNL